MKPKITPIDHEVVLADDEFIVSKTDTKGVITYVNRTFMTIAGYAEAELLGKQHNFNYFGTPYSKVRSFSAMSKTCVKTAVTIGFLLM